MNSKNLKMNFEVGYGSLKVHAKIHFLGDGLRLEAIHFLESSFPNSNDFYFELKIDHWLLKVITYE